MAKKSSSAKEEEKVEPKAEHKQEKDECKLALEQDPLPCFLEDVSCAVGNQTVIYRAGQEVPFDYILLKRLKAAGAEWK